ncbi:MAG: hypothetical protein M3Z00_06305 [Actinomycetota bacterium]|nr:hypothetical protein [Actinomycetota bacterium]
MPTEVIGPAAAVPDDDPDPPVALETALVMALDIVPAPPDAALPPLTAVPLLLDMAPLDIPPLDIAPLDIAPLDIAPLDIPPLDVALVTGAELAALVLAGAALLAAADDPVLPVLAEPQPATARTAATPTAPNTAIRLVCITTPLL